MRSKVLPLAFFALALLAPLPVVFAEDPPAEPPAAPERKPLVRDIVDGKFVDEYFGIAFAAPDLKKAFAYGGGSQVTLFNGTAEGAEVQISVGETKETLTAEQLMEHLKGRWARDGQKRTDLETGTDPRPWAVFVQESLAGFKRHHGHAWYVRGNQVFEVHAQVREKSDTSGDLLKRLVHKLEVGPATESWVMAHAAAAQLGKDPRDPLVLLQAGMAYVNQQGLNNPAVGLAVLRRAQACAKPDTFDGNQNWTLLQGMGLAQLLVGEREQSITTWKAAIEGAAKTEDPKSSEGNARYNLACAYSLLGRLDEAFEELKKSFDLAGAQLRQHSLQDPDLENMRKDPRWAELSGS